MSILLTLVPAPVPAQARPGGRPAGKAFDRPGPGEDRCPMDIRIQCLCVDSADPSKTADFWAAALGWRRPYDKPDQVVLEPPEGSPEDGVSPDLLFLRVPEGKVVK